MSKPKLEMRMWERDWRGNQIKKKEKIGDERKNEDEKKEGWTGQQRETSTHFLLGFGKHSTILYSRDWWKWVWPNFSIDLDRAEKSQVSFFFSRLARKRRKSIVDFGSDVIKLDAIEVSNYYICAFFLRNEREKKKKGKSIWYPSEFAAFYIYIYMSWPLMIITARCLLIASSKSSRRCGTSSRMTNEQSWVVENRESL